MSKYFFFSLVKLGLVVVLSQGRIVSADTLSAPVANAIVTAPSSWGTAADSWAGYTGAVSVWIPFEVKGGWTLSFQSATLAKNTPASSFWNASAKLDPQSNTFTLSSPSWSQDIAANSVLEIGFNGAGVLGSSTDLTNCKLNGQPCVISVMNVDVAKQTLDNLKLSYQTSSSAGAIPSNNPLPPSPITGNIPALQVQFSVGSSWNGGYSGTIAVKNMSSTQLPAGGNGWQARLKFPSADIAKDVFKSGPWNLAVKINEDGTAILTPVDWAAALAPGDITLSGFNGGLTSNIPKAASGDDFVTIIFATSVPNSSSTPVVINPTPDPVSDLPKPTGNPDTMLFSPYKDLTINMNWNTYVASTEVSGVLTPLVDALPSQVRAVTWAFATGECGAENWGGIDHDVLVKANLSKFVNANIDYVISTGGAAGAFTCSTEAGMRKFINRYASAHLIGIDFDIEAGQSAAAITNLVKQALAVQADYPNLRFSFTLATLGSSTGTVNSSLYGDLNVTGFNVMQAIKQSGLINYTINLMVMDYGPASTSVCVIVNGVCDMGKTAIQAAKNLNSKFGTAFTQIELTPMIGLNDVVSETFSLQDTDTMVQWAKTYKLAGVHFWSVDRDKPCTQSSASPVCSSLATVPAWEFTHRFITNLGSN